MGNVLTFERQRRSTRADIIDIIIRRNCTKDFIRKIITREGSEKGIHRHKIKYLVLFAIGNDPHKTSQKTQWRVTNKRYLPLKKRVVPCGWQIVRVSNIFIRFWTREGVAFA